MRAHRGRCGSRARITPIDAREVKPKRRRSTA
jgi:hypothetical protein